jgi:hypothetical protein
MYEVATQLEAWRQAERRRDALPAGDIRWDAVEADVRDARTRYRAEVAQATAHYHITSTTAPVAWWAPRGEAPARWQPQRG